MRRKALTTVKRPGNFGERERECYGIILHMRRGQSTSDIQDAGVWDGEISKLGKVNSCKFLASNERDSSRKGHLEYSPSGFL